MYRSPDEIDKRLESIKKRTLDGAFHKVGLGLKSAFRVILVDKNGKQRVGDWEENDIVNVGIDSILQYLGNIGGSYFAQIGVGTGSEPTTGAETNLYSPLQWKAISTDTYTRPTLFVSTEFNYTEALGTWNEIGIRDNANTLIARVVPTNPVIKDAQHKGIVQWQVGV